MNVDSDGEAQRDRAARAFRQAQLDIDQLWMHYFSMGGDAGAMETEAYLHGSYMLRPIQRDLLDHAIYELGDGHKD
ncbi:hypothetical protein [Arthrobacter sp. NPDC058192]|uniref:hypothetical protein n=1 Tax=Arthrobacter sp. NPDC058192 TaxID=3346372 RepID=UPI0036EB0672